MFELFRNENNDWYCICVDGVTYLRSQVHFLKTEPNKRLHYVSEDEEVTESLLNCKLEDLGDFELFSIYGQLEWIDYAANKYISMSKKFVAYEVDGKEEWKKTDDLEIVFELIVDLLSWKKNYSFNEYFEVIKKLSEVNGVLKNRINKFPNDGPTFNIKFFLPTFCGSIGNAIEPYISEFKKLHESATLQLDSRKYEDSIISKFNFPDKLKSSCEQYLLYFVQFLQDLGINATSNLKEEAGKVLFSVTLADDIEALDKIRETLAIYLNLPSSPIIYDDSFAAMRLQQQIENLQHSQRMAVRELQFNEKLLIAQSETIREKNVTISQLQSVNENHSKIIEKISSQAIIMNSAENKEELEKIYDGLEVGYSKWLYEKTGIKTNPVKLVKTAVQNMLGKNDETIIKLKLNEQTENEDR